MKKVKSSNNLPNTSQKKNMDDNYTPQMPFFNDYSQQDFVDHSLNFDQVIEMLRGEVVVNPISIGVNDNFNPPHIFTSNNDDVLNHDYDHLGPNSQGGDFSNFNSPTVSCTNNTLINSFSALDDDMINDGNEYDDEDNSGDGEGEGEQSSANNSGKPSKKGKVDRSRTLISERRRRGRMKEKLYALRALVPNITKMDKASIVGDAVLYVQDLQIQAKKLRAQIDSLESSFKAAERSQTDTPKKSDRLNHIPVSKIIVQMDVLQIADNEFYVKIVSNKGQGVAASLHRAVDSLNSFVIQSSNLTSLCEQFVLTFTLNVGKCMEDFNLPNLKLWISAAFVNHGFELRTFLGP